MKAKIFLREDVLNAYDHVVGDAEVRSVSLTNGMQPALPELTPWKTMREEWRTNPASIVTARSTRVIAERQSKAEEKQKLKWETHTSQPILAGDAPNLVPGP